MTEAKQLRFPQGDDSTPCNVRFKLHGQHIYDVEVIDTSFNWGSNSCRSTLLADIGRAIAKHNSKTCKGAWPDLDIKYLFAPIALRQSPTDGDAQLEGCGLVLVDFSRLAGHDPSCPRCGACNSPESNKRVVEDKSWHDRARSINGDGHVHTWYILAKKRCCWQCHEKGEQGTEHETASGKSKGKGHFFDTHRKVLDQLPNSIQQLLPGTSVELSGMSTFLRDMMTCLSQWVPPALLVAFTEARTQEGTTASEDDKDEDEAEEQEESDVEDAANVLMDLADKPTSRQHTGLKRKVNVLLEKLAPPCTGTLVKPSLAHNRPARGAVLASHVVRQAARMNSKMKATAAIDKEEDEVDDPKPDNRSQPMNHSCQPAADNSIAGHKRKRLCACKLCAFRDGIAVKLVGHDCPHKAGKTKEEIKAMLDKLPGKEKFSSKQYLISKKKPIPDWM